MSTKHETREQWLTAVAKIMWQWVLTADKAVRGRLPDIHPLKGAKPTARINQMSFSTSLMGGGFRSDGSIGHIQYKESTRNKKHAIRISPELGGTRIMDSIRVADVVLHELIHAACPNQGHTGNFPRMVRELGLDGKPTATICLPKTPLYKRLSAVVKAEGKYPHRAVSLPPKRGKRGIGSRMIKCECSCGCIIRLSRKWIAVAQFAIYCPVGGPDHDLMEIEHHEGVA